ncbi:CPBP family intramembrane glutamic endopeptidase [Dictyobacter arantiisoli]|uniref:CAAX prenyl protease 2/Lysostaphin resistance protein A-like domain-containing protein n=1 Tax=Dictyobacter arantiisoli TaxID=2014874 RepID=A0A5A5T869_9CHLR|nr:CPBP family intramembrane glutamic endopeptidase [Dictyobacter arantiisoli]GCF07356.1 hypothetical protein KDI_09200 [Dictyobacter arantiisoli]
MLKQKFDSVPWTIKQTFNGVFFTLVPWIAFIVVNSLFTTSTNPASAKPLSPQVDVTNAITSLIFSLVIYCIFLIAPFLYARRSQRAPISDSRSVWQLLGFRRFNVGFSVLLVLAALVVIIVLNQSYAFLIQTFHLHLQTNDQVILQNAKIAPITTYVSLFVAVLIAPFCEEIFFRSFTFMGLKNGMRLGVAVVMSALIFAVAHGDPGSFPILVCIGLALAGLRLVTGSYWPGFMLHLLNNGLSAVLVILAIHGITI